MAISALYTIKYHIFQNVMSGSSCSGILYSEMIKQSVVFTNHFQSCLTWLFTLAKVYLMIY